MIVVAGGVLGGYNDGVGPSALFDFMRGIVSDGAGLLITDDDNNRLRRVCPDIVILDIERLFG